MSKSVQAGHKFLSPLYDVSSGANNMHSESIVGSRIIKYGSAKINLTYFMMVSDQYTYLDILKY
jgi:hypothetical protein